MDIQKLIRLREQEQALVEKIRDEVRVEEPTARVAYLPNLMPTQTADYIVVAMEPSLAWDRNGNDQTAADTVRGGYRNFMHSWEDFILHYSLKHYLGKYYITDVSKAAMTVNNAGIWRSRMYPRWLSLLREEIDLIGTPGAKIVPLGFDVEDYLQSVSLPRPLSPRVLHFSGQAASSRKQFSDKYPDEYTQFRSKLRPEAVIASAEEQLNAFFQAERDYLGSQIPTALISRTLNRLQKGNGLTESRMRLLFTYFKQFGQLKHPV